MRGREPCGVPAADTVLARATPGSASASPTHGPPHAGPRRALNGSPAVVEASTRPWWERAPPASSPRWWRPSRAPAWRSCPAPRSPSRRATGRRAASRPRSGPTTTSRCTWKTRSRAGRGDVQRGGRADPVPTRHPTACGSSRSAASRSTARPTASLHLSLEGGHRRRRVVHAGGSATGRHLTARLSELVAAHPRIEVHERSSALALWVDDDRCVGSRDRRGRRPGARHRARHGRRRRAVEPHDQPARRGRCRPVPGAGGGRRARRPRADAVPPDRPQDRRGPRRLPGDGGRARRGRAARRCRR